MEITFCGYDGPDLVAPIINIWKDYNNREKGTSLTVWHNSKGELLEQKDKRCKVKVDDSIGYVTYWFIRELKGDIYLKKRILE